MSTLNEKDLYRIIRPLEILFKNYSYADYYFAVQSSELCVDFAKYLNLPEEDTLLLKYSALVRDIGKTSIDVDIFEKSGALTESEFLLVKSHVTEGINILSSLTDISPFFAKLYVVVSQHHERVDGKGYPSQLKAEQICVHAKILSIIDSYMAMTSDRPFRKRKLHNEALAEISRCSGTLYDPNLVLHFVEFCKKHNVESRSLSS